jgi:hypothetical protein
MLHSQRSLTIGFLLVIALVCFSTNAAAQCVGSPLTFGLQGPSKLVQTPLGNLIVAETGTPAPNSGRVSIVDLAGNRRTLLEGLPSGVNAFGDLSGTNGVFLKGRTLYVLSGEGNSTLAGAGPGLELPNPSPNSPILSSILAVHLSVEVEKTTTGFALTLADHQALKDGQTLTFSNGGGDKITVSLVADFPDYVPDPVPFLPPTNVRHSNPFGITGIGDELYVADGGRNLIFEVDADTGTFTTLATFPPIANPLPFGSPVIEAVPDSVRAYNGQLYVTLLRGFPFLPGLGAAVTVDPTTRTVSPLISGLASAIDILPVKTKGATSYLTLEISTDFLANAPGRLQRFATPAGPGVPVVTCGPLIGPSNMVRDEKTGTLYITSIFTGAIIQIPGQ